jgi:hypothetical protein
MASVPTVGTQVKTEWLSTPNRDFYPLVHGLPGANLPEPDPPAEAGRFKEQSTLTPSPAVGWPSFG